MQIEYCLSDLFGTIGKYTVSVYVYKIITKTTLKDNMWVIRLITISGTMAWATSAQANCLPIYSCK